MDSGVDRSVESDCIRIGPRLFDRSEPPDAEWLDPDPAEPPRGPRWCRKPPLSPPPPPPPLPMVGEPEYDSDAEGELEGERPKKPTPVHKKEQQRQQE